MRKVQGVLPWLTNFPSRSGDALGSSEWARNGSRAKAYHGCSMPGNPDCPGDRLVLRVRPRYATR